MSWITYLLGHYKVYWKEHKTRLSTYSMMSAIITACFATFLVLGYGAAVDSAHVFGYGALVDPTARPSIPRPLLQCTADTECALGMFCYQESHYCTPCVDCASYHRQSAWRSCPKTPADCGACLSGHEEEILHDGITRDMCIPSTPNTMSPVTAGSTAAAIPGYVWAAAILVLFVPLVYYVFCRKNWRRDRGSIHHGLPHENPPPYRSMELSTLTNNSEALLEDEDHILRVGQQKDILVQAVPFQQPNYMETELFSFDDAQDFNNVAEEVDSYSEATTVELHDESSVPSPWTPGDEDDSQLVGPGAGVSPDCEECDPPTKRRNESSQVTRAEGTSESQDCEPASKRRKASNASSTDEEASNSQYNINLFINNNVTIHKPF